MPIASRRRVRPPGRGLPRITAITRQERLFQVRSPDQNIGKNARGLGLGLFIAREVVTAHHGTIGLVSTEKEGTTVTVQLPRTPSAAPKTAGAENEQKKEPPHLDS